jgi:hypothetical protein
MDEVDPVRSVLDRWKVVRERAHRAITTQAVGDILIDVRESLYKAFRMAAREPGMCSRPF